MLFQLIQRTSCPQLLPGKATLILAVGLLLVYDMFMFGCYQAQGMWRLQFEGQIYVYFMVLVTVVEIEKVKNVTNS